MDFDTEDCHGNRASNFQNMVGRRFLHTGNHRIYRVDGFAWNGVTDTWLVAHAEDNHRGPALMVRSINNFIGERKGTSRFLEISEAPQA